MENNTKRIVPLEGVLNARELGGLPLKNGRMVRPGSLMRTGRLSDVTENDRQWLEEWNLKKIIDMRNDQEVMEHPDPQLPGVEWIQLPIFPGGAAGISREDNGETLTQKAVRLANAYSGGRARKLLQTMYPRMVTEEFCIRQIRYFFELLLNHEEGGLIWHCVSGKDRTGWTGVLLLYVLGAEWDVIHSDYLMTNEQIREYREALCDSLRQQQIDEEKIQQVHVLESVEVSYLEHCLETVKERYGSLDLFLEEQLGLTEEKITRLREKYTVPVKE